MLRYPDIDPVLLRLGPLAVRWYGLMYVLGFAAAWFVVRREIARQRFVELAERWEDLNGILLVALIAGGRLGYVLFYNLGWYLRHPVEIFQIWKGGMSFHGALIGVLAAGVFYCRRHRLPFLRVADVYVLPVPIGLGLGRLGNFINGELYGRITDVPWAMVFPSGGPWPRHPSQLYEAAGEGLVLFVFLWLVRRRIHRRGGLLACFLGGYGVIRFFLEFFRQPDPQLGFLVGFVTMGQLLSSGMVIAAALLWLGAGRALHLDKSRQKRH